MATEQELADMERMSNNYVPEVQVVHTFPEHLTVYHNDVNRGLLLEDSNPRKHSLPNMLKRTQSM